MIHTLKPHHPMKRYIFLCLSLTMKNDTVTDNLRMQERELTTPEQNFAGEKKNSPAHMQSDMQICSESDKIENKFANKQDTNSPDFGLSSVFGVLTPDTNNREEEQLPVKKKKKKRRPS